MGQDFLVLLLILIFSYAARLYSQITSVIFESVFIQLFRSLTPRYVTSYARSVLLSLIAFRNQGMSYTALSFLNSGIVQSYQSLGLIFGSYLGLSTALCILNLGSPVFIFSLLIVSLVLSFLSDRSAFYRISRLVFYFSIILASYSLMLYVLGQLPSDGYVSRLAMELKVNPSWIIPFSLIAFLALKNTFTVIGILYVLHMVYHLNSIYVFVGALSLFLYSAFQFLYKTRVSHRETKLVSFLNLTSLLVVSVVCLMIFRTTDYDFLEMLFIFSLGLGVVGLVVSFYLPQLSAKLYPRMSHSTTRNVQLYSSVYNYPSTLLIELFYQEYKKLFVHVNTTFEMMISNLTQKDPDVTTKLNKYFEISENVFHELKGLQMRLHEMEKTEKQARFVYECEIRLMSLHRFVEAIRFFQDMSASRVLENSHINFFQKIYDSSTFVLTEMIENEEVKTISMSLLLAEWDAFIKTLEEQKKNGQIDAHLCSEMQIQSMKMVESVKSLS